MSFGMWNIWFFTEAVSVADCEGPVVVVVAVAIAIAIAIAVAVAVGIVGIGHHCSDNAPSLSTVFLVMYFKQMSTQKSEFSTPVLLQPFFFFDCVRQNLRRPFRFWTASFDSLPSRALFIGPGERQRIESVFVEGCLVWRLAAKT